MIATGPGLRKSKSGRGVAVEATESHRVNGCERSAHHAQVPLMLAGAVEQIVPLAVESESIYFVRRLRLAAARPTKNSPHVAGSGTGVRSSWDSV